MAQYEIHLRRDDGEQLAVIDTFSLLQYSLLTNDVSTCRLVLPGTFNKTMLAVDRRLEIWREPAQDPNQTVKPAKVREGVWFIRHLKDWTDESGVRHIEVSGLSPNFLLSSRIVAYAANSTQAHKSAALDTMMRNVVLQNLSTGATDTDRTISTTYLSLAPSSTGAPSREKWFAWRNVLNVLQDLGDDSKGAGTDLFFDMFPLDATKFDFRTYTGQSGIDHTYPSGINPVLLGLEYGNLAEPAVEQDWSNEATYIYVGGQGEESNRLTAEVEDTARSGRSIFGRREYFQDARMVSTSTGLTAEGERTLSERRPRLRFSGRIVDVPGTRYGVHWRHGDRVSAVYYGHQYDCLIRTIEVWVDGDGEETISTRLEADE